MKGPLLGVIMAAGLLLASAVTAAAQSQGPVQSDTLYAGPYRLRVDLYSFPPFAGRRLDFDVLVSADRQPDMRGVVVAASAIPDAGTNATEVQATLLPVASTTGGFKGHVTMGVRGPWHLRFAVAGVLGPDDVSLPLQVTALAEIPIELAWAIALSPLLFLLVFAARQRRDLARLSREASPGTLAASTPPAT